ncbi:MAG: hypothetical protein ACRERD_24615, partial [Candidatus Binatia bacterium]
EVCMPAKTTQKGKSGRQETAGKRTANPRKTSRGKQSLSQTSQPFEQDVKRRIGHFSGTGEPPLMKK